MMVLPEDIDFSKFLPATEDNEALVSNFETLMMRMLVTHIPGLQHISIALNNHIQHKYSTNMALKSHVVRCDVGITQAV